MFLTMQLRVACELQRCHSSLRLQANINFKKILLSQKICAVSFGATSIKILILVVYKPLPLWRNSIMSNATKLYNLLLNAFLNTATQDWCRNSDHLPILLTVTLSPIFRPNERPPSTNFQKAR